MKQPFFSVIIPTYNRRAFIHKCVTSVITQTYKDFELVVLDDGSTDGTEEVVKATHDDRLRYFHQPNHGVASARNSAIKSAKGDFLAFLDSDDWWDDRKLEKTARYISLFPDIRIFHTEEIWYKNGKLLNQKPKHKKPDGWVYPQALPLCCISISTAAVQRTVIDSIGLFDENMAACEDYDFWLRAASRFEVKLIPEPLTLKDGGRPDQLSSSVWGLDRFRIKALEKMLSSGSLSPEYHRLTLEELHKKCVIFAAGARKRGKPDEAEQYLALAKKYDTQ